jgi:predicted ATPase
LVEGKVGRQWNLPLLERDSLLEELERLLGSAASGEGSLVLIAGEAGSGKTSVVRAFVERVSDRALILTGGCDPLTTPRPLSPVLDIAADPDSHLGSLVAEGAAPLELFSALLNRVKGTLRPSILVIEDVHWADEGTLDFLRFMGRRISDSNALALCTYRDDEIGQTHPLRIVIGDLAPRDSIVRMAVDLLSLDECEPSPAGPGSTRRCCTR